MKTPVTKKTPATTPAAAPFVGLTQQVTLLCTEPTQPTSALPTLPPSGAVQHTTQYHLFSLLDANRPLNQGHVQKLVEQIRQNNLLHIRPLDVTPELEVIDGQHRLAAAKELGLPVYYRITQQLTEADIASLNTASKNWLGVDYLHYWTEKGQPAYVALTDFRQRHPRISFSNAKMMVSGSTNNRAADFRAGTWQAGQLEKAEQVAGLIERIAAETPFKQAADTRFVAAVYHCAANVAGFKPEHFMGRILRQPRALVPCATHKQYLELFQEIYNYNTTQEHRVRFF